MFPFPLHVSPESLHTSTLSLEECAKWFWRHFLHVMSLNIFPNPQSCTKSKLSVEVWPTGDRRCVKGVWWHYDANRFILGPPVTQHQCIEFLLICLPHYSLSGVSWASSLCISTSIVGEHPSTEDQTCSRKQKEPAPLIFRPQLLQFWSASLVLPLCSSSYSVFFLTNFAAATQQS